MTAHAAFIGAGNIARCIIAGMVAGGFDEQRIVVAERNAARLKSIRAEYSGLQTAASNSAAAAGCPVVVLCVKPDDMQSACAEIASAISGRSVLASVAAGVPVACLSAWTRGCRRIVRCMPNTPIAVGKGVVAMHAGAGASSESRERVQELFNPAAVTVWLDEESLMNSATALSGSGPAYFFGLAEIFGKAAIAAGWERGDAGEFALRTLLCGAEFVEQYGWVLQDAPDDIVRACEEYFADRGSGRQKRTLDAACLACLLMFTAGLRQAAVASGLGADTAVKMTHATLSGAAAFAADEGDVHRLREQVASKGGTTREALKVLERAPLQKMLAAAKDDCRLIAPRRPDIERIARGIFTAANERAIAMEAEMMR